MAREILRVTLYAFRQWRMNIKVLLTLALLIVFLIGMANPLQETTSALGYAISPAILPFLLSSEVNQLILAICFLFLLSDAPFMNEAQLFVIQRTGRLPWVLGQVLYVMLSAAIFLAVLALIVLIVIAPYATFSCHGWGKVVTTLAYTDAGQQLHLAIPFSAKIIESLEPAQALLLELLLEYLALAFVGLLMFVINLVSSTKIGLYASGFVCLYDILAVNTLPNQFLWVSPLSMARLSVLNFASERYQYPTPLWAFLFSLSLLIALTLIAGLFAKRMPITAAPEE